MARAAEAYPDARQYRDYREMLEAEQLYVGPDGELLAANEEKCRADPTFRPMDEWKAAFPNL